LTALIELTVLGRLALLRAGHALPQVILDPLSQTRILGLLGMGCGKAIDRRQTCRCGGGYHTLAHRTNPFKKIRQKRSSTTERRAAVCFK
jgi:hypothetical protein